MKFELKSRCRTLFWDIYLMWVPMCVSALGMYLQLVFLHYSTYRYVQKYAFTDEDAMNAIFMNVTMYDVGWEYIPYGKVDLHTLDKLAFFPAGVFFVMTVVMLKYSYSSSSDPRKGSDGYRQTIHGVWTKVCVMWALLAILKGIFDSVTLQPDSSGWLVCEERIHPEWGVAFMRQSHTFWDMFSVDYQFYKAGYTPPMRLCSDMMYSGHTFTVVVFALGVNELALIAMSGVGVASWKKFAATTLIWLYVFIQQGYEIYMVLKCHFHYTNDIVGAILFSLLIWTNSVVPYTSKLWARKQWKGLIPAAALQWFAWKKGKDLGQPLLDKKELLLESHGDILTPWVCFPFCLFHGRHHLYTDRQFEKLLTKLPVTGTESEKKKEIEKAQIYCRRFMSMNDGVYFRECFDKDVKSKDTQLQHPDTPPPKCSCKPLLQLLFPIFILTVSSGVCVFCFTCATYMYVQNYGLSHFADGSPNLRYNTTLDDPFREWFNEFVPDSWSAKNNGKYEDFIIYIATASAFVCLVLMRTTRPCALQVMHKVFICCGLIQVCTAVLAVVTSVPDASGMDKCKKKLGADDWDWMTQEHDLSEIFQKSLGYMFEVVSFSPVRDFCGTGFASWLQWTCICSLGLFEWSLLLLRWKCFQKGGRIILVCKFLMLAVIIAVTISMIFRSIIKFEKLHTHYTMDWIMSVSLGLLLYTNSAVAITAKWFTRKFQFDFQESNQELHKNLESDGDILIPPCCFPFCLMWGRYHVYFDNKVQNLYDTFHTELSPEMKAKMSVGENFISGIRS